MLVTSLSLRNFRSYEAAEVALGPGLTVVWGRNGVGKTNLLEALYFACTGRSCRTANEREVVRFGGGFTRLEARTVDERHRRAARSRRFPGYTSSRSTTAWRRATPQFCQMPFARRSPPKCSPKNESQSCPCSYAAGKAVPNPATVAVPVRG